MGLQLVSLPSFLLPRTRELFREELLARGIGQAVNAVRRRTGNVECRFRSEVFGSEEEELPRSGSMIKSKGTQIARTIAKHSRRVDECNRFNNLFHDSRCSKIGGLSSWLRTS